ncbi:DNA-binding protein [Rhizorhabdus dicambivorans]|uniref:DNA-binding protein n=2 Tax=Rhizorhabdus dicambivorans TaxID=1850238 RepID=A0A2A4FX15_9SPHN|nr:DNA-binding protein [Rhizorhabdus dicambivorans]PCE42720.1 DNA-binding protein [Rhizorhabdus dicambivorans]
MIAPPSTRSITNNARLAYSIDEVAKATGLGRTTLYAIIKQGRLPVVKLGKRTLIRSDDLEQLLTPHSPTTDCSNDSADLIEAAPPTMTPEAREEALRAIERNMDPIPLSILHNRDQSLYTKAYRARRAEAEQILARRELQRTS